MKAFGVLFFFLFILAFTWGENWSLKNFIDGEEGLEAQAVFQGTSSTQTFAPPADKPGWLTLGYLKSQWIWDRETAVVGEGTVWIPSKGWGPGEKEFVRKLILFLKDQLAEKKMTAPGPGGNSFYEPDKTSFLVDNFNLPGQLSEAPEFRLLQPFYRKGILSGRQQVQFRDEGGAWTTSKSFGITLRSFCEVPTLRRNLEAKLPIEDSDWSWQSKDISLLPQDVWVPEENVSMETVKSVVKGEVLRLGTNCRVVMPVSRGDRVMVTLVKGNLAVELPAQALDEGKLGQKIRIRLESGRTMEAEVNGNDSLREELP